MTDLTKKETNLTIGRRNLLRGIAALGAVGAAPYYANAANLNKGAGNIRKIFLRNDRTGEIMDLVYWADGRYIDESLQEINLMFRDWRQNKVANVDAQEIDIISTTHRMLDTSEPFLLISGYRTPTTNRRVGGASHSYHTKAMAADLRIGSRSVKQISGAAAQLAAGGIGRYYRSNFVHLDSGPVRSWRG